jgi:hypothetical protein
MTRIIITLIFLTLNVLAQNPIPSPIETTECDVYDTRKVTEQTTIILCDSTAYVYGLNVVVNEPGSGGKITIGGQNSIASLPTNIMNYAMSWVDGVASFGGIKITSTAANCDIDVTIDYRKAPKR